MTLVPFLAQEAVEGESLRVAVLVEVRDACLLGNPTRNRHNCGQTAQGDDDSSPCINHVTEKRFTSL